MSLPKIYGVYLNNMNWHQIKSIYLDVCKEGEAKYKVERINEIISSIDQFPKNEIIEQYLFAGRISVNWYKLKNEEENTISIISEKLRKISPDIFTQGDYPKLSEGFKFIHAIEKENKLFITLGTGDYRDAITIKDYNLTTQPTEYFATAIIRNSSPVLEIRANEMIRGEILDTLIKTIGITPAVNFGRKNITQTEFMNFKSEIPDSEIKKYKGSSLNPKSITELFEFTARQDIDYAANITEFEKMRDKMKDLSLTIIFNYADSTFPLRLNLLTGSIYFPSIISEDAIDYIYEIYRRTMMEL